MADPRLAGRRVLIVEDDYFMADDLRAGFERAGAHVVGPVGRLGEALDLIARGEPLDAAVLDINLSGEMAYAAADALMERGVPFVFATGYDSTAIPPRYKEVARCEKPVGASKIARALFG